MYTLLWTEDENACLGEVIGGPVLVMVYVCLQGALLMGAAKLVHWCVRDADEMASFDP